MSRPGVLSVRTINQYRRRDVIAYLGLRYYLDNTAARQDIWARDVAAQLERTGTGGGYLLVKHFKELDDRGAANHRDIYIPRPNEALAEAALIEACAQAGGLFQPSNNVYSYLLPEGNDRQGVFRNYMDGLKSRHNSIAKACEDNPDSIVCFRDLRKFYPSIRISLAHDAWEAACSSSTIDPSFTELGHALLERHGNVSGGNLLTGPIFSHLIGNLILKGIDDLPLGDHVRVFRYVDDFTLVGRAGDVAEALKRIEDAVGALQLELHPADSPKSLDVPGSQWLESKSDFQEAPSEHSWKSLIGDVKYLLRWHPERAKDLGKMLENEGIRLPMRDYREAVDEASFLTKAIQKMSWHWYRQRTRSITPRTVLEQARFLREKYVVELEQLLEKLRSADAFSAKRYVPMARYRLGRLSYLAKPDVLVSMSESTEELPQLRFHSEVARAIATKNVDRLLALGPNAAQAAAQPLRTVTRQVTLSRQPSTEAEEQSLIVLALNGIRPSDEVGAGPNSELHRFAVEGGSLQLMQSESKFIAEVSSLHGIGAPRHTDVLDTAFDYDEDLALDAIDQARTSMSL